MKKNYSLSGMFDYSPSEMRLREYVLVKIKRQLDLFGFSPISTPIMEKRDNLFGGYNEDGDKLIFQVLKSGDYMSSLSDKYDDINDISRLISDKALRYDLTLPFARFVAQNLNNLNLPFRRYQIGSVFRADRPQKGRLREFIQCDADIIGTTSLWSEIDLICLLDSVFQSLSLDNLTIRLNNRKILEGLFNFLSLSISFAQFCTIIDKIDKIGIEKVSNILVAHGCSIDKRNTLLSLFNLNGDFAKKKSMIISEIKNDYIFAGLEDMSYIFSHLNKLSIVNNTIFDISLARGLDYYTGTIFEVVSDSENIGSIVGGGRYDSLTDRFGVKGVSGVGLSFGLDRICIVLKSLNLLNNRIGIDLDFLFVNFGIEESVIAQQYVKKLRQLNYSATLYPDSIKISKQLNYANKIHAKYVIIVGDEEIKEEKIKIKNMLSGTQKTLSFSELIKILQSDEKEI